MKIIKAETFESAGSRILAQIAFFCIFYDVLRNISASLGQPMMHFRKTFEFFLNGVIKLRI